MSAAERNGGDDGAKWTLWWRKDLWLAWTGVTVLLLGVHSLLSTSPALNDMQDVAVVVTPYRTPNPNAAKMSPYTPFDPPVPPVKVGTVYEELGSGKLLDVPIEDLVQQRTWPVRVALYMDYGVTVRSSQALLDLFSCHPNLIQVTPILKIRQSVLTRRDFDAVVIGGGLATKVMRGQKKTAAALQKFIKNGAGYLGICAGAFVASKLHLTAFQSIAAGKGQGTIDHVEVSPWFANEALVPVDSSSIYTTPWFYANGPFMSRKNIIDDNPAIKPGNCMVRMVPESKVQIFGEKTPLKLRKERACLMAANSYGEGTVVTSTAHPELDITFNKDGKRIIEATQCGSPQAQLLVSAVLLAANRTKITVDDLDQFLEIGELERQVLSSLEGFAEAEDKLWKDLLLRRKEKEERKAQIALERAEAERLKALRIEELKAMKKKKTLGKKQA